MNPTFRGWRDLNPYFHAILRIMVGLLFLEHGTTKLFAFPLTSQSGHYVFLTLNPGIQALIELIGGILITLGLWTRPAAFILCGDMAAAYFIAHAPRSFFPLVNGGQSAVLFCFIFLFFSTAGAGAWSLDRARGVDDRL